MEGRDRHGNKETYGSTNNSVSQGRSSGSKRQCDAKRCGNELPSGSSDEYFTFGGSTKQSYGRFCGSKRAEHPMENSMTFVDGVIRHGDWPKRRRGHRQR